MSAWDSAQATPTGSGGEILPEARIIAVADIVDAMASYCPYRPALGQRARGD
ncbi:hypothetical protein MASR2M17_20820 [Aminivibrio sp.]